MVDQYPLITIGITCFNAEDTIAEALDSALSQNYPNFEIIIVDDVSLDKSVSVVQQYVEQHGNVRLIVHEKNQGVAAARNTIIENASGAFVAFFDDDDTSDAQRLLCQYNKLVSYEQQQGTDLVACWASGFKLYDNGYKFFFEAIGSKDDIPVGQDMVDYHLFFPRKKNIFYGSGTPSCSLLLRKSIYDRVGLYDVNMRRLEDGDFTMRLALAGGHFIGCPERLLVQTASTGDDKNAEAGYKSEIQLIEKYRQYFRSARHFGFASEWIKLRYLHFSGKRWTAIGQLLKLFVFYPVATSKQFWRVVPNRLRHERNAVREAL